jgi:glyoxylase-like metal-dependent hydrolase (beta-lactamase superfamily II)
MATVYRSVPLAHGRGQRKDIGMTDDRGSSESDGLPVAASWFTVTWVTGRTAVLTEPHVDDLLRANLWYLRGRERDLLVDAGNGAASLPPVLARLTRGGRRDVLCLVTHAHIDHIGGFHEFERRLLHPAEGPAAARIGDEAPLATASWSTELKDKLAESGFALPPVLVDAVPEPGFDPVAFHIVPAAPTHLVHGGDEIDLGGRTLSVVDLPGHTPGSVGLIDHEESALLSGDAVYDGGLIDTLPESDVAQYLRTMERLRTVDVDVVYPGHGGPFGRERLRELAAAYLRERGS